MRIKVPTNVSQCIEIAENNTYLNPIDWAEDCDSMIIEIPDDYVVSPDLVGEVLPDERLES